MFSLAYGSVANELKSKGTKKHDGSVLKITEDGVLFRSYRDGSKVLLTPESSIQAQKDLGADIIIPFDELPPYHIEKKALVNSLERTTGGRSALSMSICVTLKVKRSMPSCMAASTPSCGKKLRLSILTTLDGFAIGGSLGKTKQELFELLDYVPMHLDREKPNHLLGIGDLESIDQAVLKGIDTLDSSYPHALHATESPLLAKGP